MPPVVDCCFGDRRRHERASAFWQLHTPSQRYAAAEFQLNPPLRHRGGGHRKLENTRPFVDQALAFRRFLEEVAALLSEGMQVMQTGSADEVVLHEDGQWHCFTS